MKTGCELKWALSKCCNFIKLLSDWMPREIARVSATLQCNSWLQPSMVAAPPPCNLILLCSVRSNTTLCAWMSVYTAYPCSAHLQKYTLCGLLFRIPKALSSHRSAPPSGGHSSRGTPSSYANKPFCCLSCHPTSFLS